MGCVGVGPRPGVGVPHCLVPPRHFSFPIPPLPFINLYRHPLTATCTSNPLHTSTTTCLIPKFRAIPCRAQSTLDDGQAQISAAPSLTRNKVLLKTKKLPEGDECDVEECVRVLKNAAKTRKVPGREILQAFSVIEKAKLDPSGFFQTLGGTESPGRTWMLIFTAEKKLTSGKYFPITAVQRFDAVGKRIENGVYLGPLGSLTFEGRLSWNNRILAFIFERIRVKIGPLGPLEYSFKGKEEKEPSNKDPFFIWFYVDEEIAVARGRSGGTAFWVRCQRIAN